MNNDKPTGIGWINTEFAHLFEFKNERERLRHDAQLISFRFLSEVQNACDKRNLNMKELAELVGVSPSYITQPFNGDKAVNMSILAKFQRKLDIHFKIESLELRGLRELAKTSRPS